MNLQTQIPLQPQDVNRIDYNSKVFLMGSCFVENIGNRFEYYKFQNTINPFRILFHSRAIETLINNAINKKKYTDDDVFFHNEQWHAFDAHSELSNPSKTDILEDLNNAVNLTRQQLFEATHIVITLGTAWVYKYIEENKIVANCHKMPPKAFKKVLLSIDAIRASLESCIAQIQSANPKATIIFTVSPVRHIKDGFVENTQSKAHLIAAIHEVISSENQSHYFPSYEIMMDELRDYRFYNDDMLHPNRTAIDYIWKKFQYVWLNPNTEQTMVMVEAIQKGLLHKPFNPNSDAHLQFLKQLEVKQKELQSQFSHIIF